MSPGKVDDLKLVSFDDNVDQDEHFDFHGYVLPAKYLKDSQFLEFVTDLSNYHEYKYLLDS